MTTEDEHREFVKALFAADEDNARLEITVEDETPTQETATREFLRNLFNR